VGPKSHLDSFEVKKNFFPLTGLGPQLRGLPVPTLQHKYKWILIAWKEYNFEKLAVVQ
jgi:hypothetical protein